MRTTAMIATTTLSLILLLSHPLLRAQAVDLPLFEPSSLNTPTTSRPHSTTTTTRFSFDDLPLLSTRLNLTLPQRRALLHAASLIFSQLHPYRPLTNALHNADPFSKLQALLNNPSLHTLPPLRFHALLRHIFASANDFHTLYLPPEPLRSHQLSLGFSLQSFYHKRTNRPRFLVSHVSERLVNHVPKSFRKGVRVLRVDEQSIYPHVWNLGKTSYAANPAAIIARGTDAVTLRPMALFPLPSSKVVRITYRTPANRLRTISLPWTPEPVTDPYLLGVLDRVPSSPSSSSSSRASSSASKFSYIPNGAREHIPVSPEFAILFDAYTVRTLALGKIGVLHVKSFFANASPPLMAELTRLLGLLPTSGLVIDVRANWGGTADIVKAMTELYSNVSIPSLPCQMQASSLVGKIVSSDSLAGMPIADAFRPAWRAAHSVKEDFTTPASNLFTLSLPAAYPVQQRVYNSPVVTLMDARSFSAAELFVAVQRDTGASTVVGVDKNTAGGGAATVRFNALQALYPDVFGHDDVGEDVNFRTAVIRYFRSGRNSGAFIEKFGVEPDLRYYRTKTDIVHDDAAMFEYLANVLKSKAG